MSVEKQVTYSSLDGLILAGTTVEPTVISPGFPPVLLVHGITADRHESGFFSAIAAALAERGVPSLRFDLRAHGESQGAMETLTVYGCVSDISASASWLMQHLRVESWPALIGASFGGGLAVLFAARHRVARLTLLNPNLDFRESWFESTDKWEDGRLSSSAVAHLIEHGWLPRGEFRMGAAFVHEAIQARPASLMRTITAPTIVIHGTEDTFTSFHTSLENSLTADESHFVRIEGAEHGFIVPGDEQTQDPRTHEFRAKVIAVTVDWNTNLISRDRYWLPFSVGPEGDS
jgi:uncharacterized protein